MESVRGRTWEQGEGSGTTSTIYIYHKQRGAIGHSEDLAGSGDHYWRLNVVEGGLRCWCIP